MNLFPFFEDVENKTFLVVGGGRVATGKVEKLLQFTQHIHIVAEDLTEMERFLQSHRLAYNAIKGDYVEQYGTRRQFEENAQALLLFQKSFRDVDLASADYVIGATNNRAVNKEISDLCKQENIPVNIVDDPELCTFIFPSLVKRGDFVAGITTAGKSPAFGQYTRRLLEEVLPEDTEDIIDELYALKLRLKETEPDQKERARQLKDYLEKRVGESACQAEGETKQ